MFPEDQAEKREVAMEENSCPKCHEHFIVHGSDGSCVDDVLLEMEQAEREAMALIDEIEPTFYDYENQAWVKNGFLFGIN